MHAPLRELDLNARPKGLKNFQGDFQVADAARPADLRCPGTAPMTTCDRITSIAQLVIVVLLFGIFTLILLERLRRCKR